uniref:Putative secreted protein n=1 Tax=Ixodes ricinus TaxID=34613 RepID=A0A6B0U0B1_IXORI
MSLVILSWAAEARFWLLALPVASPSFCCCFSENSLIIVFCTGCRRAPAPLTPIPQLLGYNNRMLPH